MSFCPVQEPKRRVNQVSFAFKINQNQSLIGCLLVSAAPQRCGFPKKETDFTIVVYDENGDYVKRLCACNLLRSHDEAYTYCKQHGMALAVIDSNITQLTLFTASINFMNPGYREFYVDGKFLNGAWYSVSYSQKPVYSGLMWGRILNVVNDALVVSTAAKQNSFDVYRVESTFSSNPLQFICETLTPQG